MNNSRSVVRLAVATEETKRTACTRGTAERREPKRGRMDSRESERPDSTVDVGELAAQRGPGGGKRGVTSNNRCWELRRVLRNLNNVSKTASDRGTALAWLALVHWSAPRAICCKFNHCTCQFLQFQFISFTNDQHIVSLMASTRFTLSSRARARLAAR